MHSQPQDCGNLPKAPDVCVDEACGSTNIHIEEAGIERRDIMDSIAGRLDTTMWRNVTRGEAVRGGWSMAHRA